MTDDRIAWNDLVARMRGGGVERMTLADFERLDEYSCSLPSGTIVGKRWRRRVPYQHDSGFRPTLPSREYSACVIPGPPPSWYLGEYLASDVPGEINIAWRRIELLDGTFDGT